MSGCTDGCLVGDLCVTEFGGDAVVTCTRCKRRIASGTTAILKLLLSLLDQCKRVP